MHLTRSSTSAPSRIRSRLVPAHPGALSSCVGEIPGPKGLELELELLSGKGHLKPETV